MATAMPHETSKDLNSATFQMLWLCGMSTITVTVTAARRPAAPTSANQQPNMVKPTASAKIHKCPCQHMAASAKASPMDSMAERIMKLPQSFTDQSACLVRRAIPDRYTMSCPQQIGGDSHTHISKADEPDSHVKFSKIIQSHVRSPTRMVYSPCASSAVAGGSSRRNAPASLCGQSYSRAYRCPA